MTAWNITPETIPPGRNPIVRERLLRRMLPYLEAAPLALILGAFLVVPMIAIFVVSFWGYDSVQPVPDFTLENYSLLLTSRAVWLTFLNTFRFAANTWAITLVLGFSMAFYLAFFVRSSGWRMALLIACTVPFWTSNVIRMIAWLPLLGREGLVNALLLKVGLIIRPLDALLYSDFAVILAYVQLYTLFMLAPILNSMARIDRSIIEAAIDAGAGLRMIMFEIVAPLAKTGITIGSVLVIALVLGDFITLRVMSGGQSPAVGLMIYNEIGLVQYPDAAAASMLLLVAVMMVVGAILRFVDIRREL